MLAPGGRVALLVGSEVVYIGGRGASPATMTPYDIAAVRLTDGLELAGSLPEEIGPYLDALRRDRAARAVALAHEGMTAAADVVALVERLAGTSWAAAESSARAAGTLLGAYPAEG